mmetsp:Transcript_829/g.1835  ORF Transcript_829/g.1835 Transcript_829/m.1835 type:complete len:82 (-) Transcript_829:275-520(-)
MACADSLELQLEPDGRVEMKCSNCHGHLGHIFEPDDGAKRTNQRHCVNDSSIQYVGYSPPEKVVEAGKLQLPQSYRAIATG